MSSIRNRILLALVSAGMLPIMVFLVLTQTITSRVIRESEFKKIEEIGQGVSRSAEALMSSAWSDLQNLRTNPILNNTSAPIDVVRTEFNRVVSSYSQFSDIILYEKDTGFYVTSKRETPVQMERDFTTWIKTASLGDITVGRPNIEDNLQSQGLSFSIPYYIPISPPGAAPTKYIAKAVFDFSGTLWKVLRQSEFGSTGHIVLVDEKDNVLWHREEARIMTVFERDKRKRSWWSHERGNYEEEIFASTKLDDSKTRCNSNWAIVAFLSKKEAYSLVTKSNYSLLAAGILPLLASIAIGILLSNKISSPVTDLSLAARSVAKGQLDTHIPEKGPQELRYLAKDFNGMVYELKQHRQDLERIVAERTKNLRVSQEKLSQTTAQLRASYDSTQEAILVVNPLGNVLTANKRFLEIFQGFSLESIRDTSISTVIANNFKENEEFLKHWERCNDSLSLTEKEEWSTVAPKEGTLESYCAPVKDSQNVTIARLWMFRDLTEQRKLELGLRQAQKMEAIGRLAGGIAHDFNNLLTGIIGNLSLVELEVDSNSDRKDRLIVSAKNAGQRAAELVKQLLGFSRQSHLKIESFNANDIAKEVKELLVHSIDPAISINLDLADDLWPVDADPNQLQQVLMNLAVNAKDAIGSSKGNITIRTNNVGVESIERAASSNSLLEVKISVSDSGCGMSEEVMSKIFEPFFTTKEQGKGTGLGLATSYGIIEQHGGRIRCRSKVGFGTSFDIYLPKGVTEDSTTNEPKQRNHLRLRGSETVLLVDDDLVVRMVGESVLKHHGYCVLTASDGLEALDIIKSRSEAPDLVMLDLTMPKLSGRETFRALRIELESDIPVVICSGYLVDLEDFRSESNSVPEGFVQKPYDSIELVKTLRSVLDGKNLGEVALIS